MSILGVSPAELSDITRVWRAQSTIVKDLDWSIMASITGSGSEVLAAVRACAVPVAGAMSSIADRFSTLADKVDRFGTNIVELDSDVSVMINDLPSR